MLRSKAIALVATLTAGLFVALTAAAGAAVAGPSFPLYLPVPVNATVWAGGPHCWDGSTSCTSRSSVDIGPPSGGEMAVYAAAPGIAHVHGTSAWPRCWVAIDHTDGWQTRYYHLKNIPTSLDGTTVSAGTRLGDAGQPAASSGQATETCGKGTANFRHVHFALFRNGTAQPIDGLSIGGYTVHQTGAGYCGYWTRDSDGAIVADARTKCYSVPALVNNQSLSSPGPASYTGHVVQWNGDTKTQKTSWYVAPDAKRLWVPDTTTYNCLKSHGVPGPDSLSSQILDRLPDQRGRWVPCGNQMWTNRELRQGMGLRSADGRFLLILQTDGNFVLYGAGRALWASGHAADYVVMQSDGNFVGYLNNGTATWATGTSGSGATHLIVQSDGNVVLYSSSKAVWSTRTSWAGEAGHIVQWSGDTKAQKTAWYVTPDLRREWIPDAATYYCLKGRGAPGPDVLSSTMLNHLPDQTNMWVPCGDTMATNRTLRRGMSLRSSDGRYLFVLQGDGNLVLYGPSGHALWANNKFNTDFAIMQSDGNFVCYTNGGSPTWASNTAGSGGNRLVVQSDGNVVIYSSTRAVWATNTAGRT
jgi:hypothetical protein